MSFLNDCRYVDLTEFHGPNQLLDQDDLQEPDGISAENVEYSESQVATRRGFAQAWNPNKIIRTMYNWIQQQFNRMIYLNSDNNVISRDLSTGTETTILSSVTAAGMVCIQAGYRLYMSFFATDGTGAATTKVWDGTSTSGTPNVESVFRRPLVVAGANPDLPLSGGNWAVFSADTPGVTNPYPHAFALVVTTWNGYQMYPGPIDQTSSLGSFYPNYHPQGTISPTPVRFTVTVTPNTTWPLWVNTIQLAMTRGNDVDETYTRWYLVPGQIVTVTRGSSTPVVFTVNIDDVTLAGNATEITDTLFNLYHQTPAATGPTSPHCIFSLNNRAVYLTRLPGPDGTSLVGTILVSEQFKPQYVTLNEHMLNLPEFRDTVTGFALGGTAFILGPNWTYAFSDNLRVPVSWAPPRLVSGDIGSPFIRGVSVNQSRGYAWVADHVGLFCLSGANFPIRPTSYKQTPDWNRINFAAPANALRVIELPDSRQVVVKAPIDGETVASHLLVWDYTYGTSWDKVRYCGMWDIKGCDNIGDIETVENYTKKVMELWVSHGDENGNVLRRKSIEAGDATAAEPTPLYTDDGVGIYSKYRLLAVSQAARGVMQQIGGSFRVKGGGQLTLKAYSFDGVRETTMAPIGTSYTVSGGGLTSIVVLSNVGTVTLAAAHGLTVGTYIEIAGATVDADLNGYYTIATVPTTTTFTIATVSVSNGTYNNSALRVTWGNSPIPGQRHLRLLDEQSEVMAYEIGNGDAPNCWFVLAALRAYFKEWMEMR